MGSGDWMVVEADESDGSFLRLPATIAVVTNMDPEHLDHWGTAEAMQAAYDQFVANVPFYGFAVLCMDHPVVQQMIPRLSDHRIITYGFSPQADVRAERLVADKRGATFEVAVTDRARNRSRRLGPFRLPMLGSHNVSNALAAIAVAVEMEIDDATLRSAFAGFRGVKRRFTRVGEAGGISIVDDYGHHPVEIAAVLKAARQAGARDVVAAPSSSPTCTRPARRRSRGSTATRWSTGCARAAIAAWCRCPAPSTWRRSCTPSPVPATS